MLTRAAHLRLVLPSMLILALAAGCAPMRPALNLNDGRQHFVQDRASATIACGGLPFVVDANRVSLTITGRCGHIVVAGNHNDVLADVLGGGTVEITGAHNDVTWRQVSPGPRPALVDRGLSNSFHRGIREDDASS